MDFKRIVQQWLLLMVGIFVAAKLVGGIHYESTGSVVAVVLILSFLNMVLRPLLVLIALPFVIVTLGFGFLIINGLLFLLVGELVPGFSVDGFGAAFWGAVIVSLTGFVANLILGGNKVEVQSTGNVPVSGNHSKKIKNDDDVIDI